ncbi:putative carboxylic ester hydrolase [Rosa chinensis]|uniref:Putative carboxylic ester hydrolase n=1 Tax=Rosa chinensis TaxID=74649 RepID=A0A2P6P8S5_ROSCH|nr:phospholipase A1-Ibeta2, chloroplastic [Rosa chinensis]PRQ18333.1 putative carboxylic ester hydrolase [Rosa chinensis]
MLVGSQSVNLFQATNRSFKNYTSPLNPLTRTPSSCSYSASASNCLTIKSSAATSISKTELSLANLDKLLPKSAPPQPPQLDPQPGIEDRKTKRPTENKGKGFLEGLSLARLWPQVKAAAEEMSPRHLKTLRRLLSKTAEYSPRNSLSSKWREYHGSKNWAGLLDPLDENLRREVVRYGEFIQAAYQSFHSNPAMSVEETQMPRNVALPDRSYKVTKSLYATSAVGLPDWVDDVAPDLGWMTQRSSWIGYVAVCDDRREIARMGRRDIVIALRGTSTCLEWAENMRAQLIQMPPTEEGGEEAQAKVECGFQSLYKTPGAHVPSLSESVVEEIKRLKELYKGEQLSITVTGHSLGAAIALLVGDELKTCAEDMPPVAVFSFGGPRVGNRGFANRMEAKNVKVLRIVNSQDLITRVPGIFIGEGALEEKLKNSKFGDMLDKNLPLAYAHVGTELRVDTKMSPYLKPNADVACCHDLEAYLHLVDGFLASNCPFRKNAKRSLVRLLQDQGSNVKKLYISKANNLSSLNLEREGFMASCLPSPSA